MTGRYVVRMVMCKNGLRGSWPAPRRAGALPSSISSALSLSPPYMHSLVSSTLPTLFGSILTYNARNVVP